VGAGNGGTAGAGVAGTGGAAGGEVEDMMHAFWQVVATVSQPVAQPAGVCACVARKFRSAAHVGLDSAAIDKTHATKPQIIAIFRDPKAVRLDGAEDMRSPFNSRRDIKAVRAHGFH